MASKIRLKGGGDPFLIQHLSDPTAALGPIPDLWHPRILHFFPRGEIASLSVFFLPWRLFHNPTA
jgi:hypothetical protein